MSIGVGTRPEHWLRGTYWWYFAGIGALSPFLALYYRERGFSGLEIGVLAAMPPLGTVVLAPSVGALADARAGHRLLLRVGLVIACGAAALLGVAGRFATSLLFVVLLALGSAPVAALLDSYGVTVAEQRHISYGSLRVWGSVGYTVSVWAVGWWMGGRVSGTFLLAYAAALLLAFAATTGLPPQRRWAGVPGDGDTPGTRRNRPLLILLLTGYLVSLGAGVMYNFLGIRLAALGGGADLLGLAFALAALSEIPILALGGPLLARVGARRLLISALGIYAVRLLLYSLLPGPAWVLPVQLLHGATYGAFLLASVTLAHELTGHGRAATSQGLLAAMSVGLGSVTGALAGGALLDRVGVVTLFRLASGLVLLALVVFLVGSRPTAEPTPARSVNT